MTKEIPELRSENPEFNQQISAFADALGIPMTSPHREAFMNGVGDGEMQGPEPSNHMDYTDQTVQNAYNSGVYLGASIWMREQEPANTLLFSVYYADRLAEFRERLGRNERLGIGVRSASEGLGRFLLDEMVKEADVNPNFDQRLRDWMRSPYAVKDIGHLAADFQDAFEPKGGFHDYCEAMDQINVAKAGMATDELLALKGDFSATHKSPIWRLSRYMRFKKHSDGIYLLKEMVKRANGDSDYGNVLSKWIDNPSTIELREATEPFKRLFVSDLAFTNAWAAIDSASANLVQPNLSTPTLNKL